MLAEMHQQLISDTLLKVRVYRDFNPSDVRWLACVSQGGGNSPDPPDLMRLCSHLRVKSGDLLLIHTGLILV